jgi:2-oxoisovalerate dehydrogenase E1 component
MAEAVNLILAEGLEQIPSMRLFGEDIEAPKGGVFGLTKGLSDQFPQKVTNAPLAEATIVGAGVGLAATGYRPVFELQFTDFIPPAFNQLVSQVATLRWRSYGEWTCPLVLYAPYGAYFQGGGIWHTQSNDGWWAHIPGLRVAVPSTPEDAAGLFWSAFHDEDPSLLLLPKALFRKRVEAMDWETVPFGKAKVRRTGDEVTVVTWGNGVSISEDAAERAAAEGISVEVIDLRTLNPCDWEAIVGSIQKTGRLVVVQEDTRACSFGDAIVSRVTADTNFVYYFYSPPRIVSRADHYVPYCPELCEGAVPGVEEVLQAVREVMK